jgi:multidrug efflux pump subunit AcrB
MQSVEDLEGVPVGGTAGRTTQLREIADAIPSTSFGEVDRVNNQRTVSVTANLAGRDLADAARLVRAEIAALGEPPRGIRVVVRGQVEQMEQTLAGLREGLLLALVVIALLLVASFQSVRDPLCVVATAPAVLAGVIGTLLVTDSSLNVQSMMGAVMSIGVSIANAVLMVSFYRDRRRAGASREDAVIEAASGRLRPVVMTSAAMIAGMIPMALALGGGGDQNAPLGIAVVGGLGAATVATLLVLPAVLATVGSKRPWRSSSLAPDDGPRTATPAEQHPTQPEVRT